jgi:hypothetical protein
MPTYDYSCTNRACPAVGKPFEKTVKRFDSAPPACEVCQQPSQQAEVSRPRRFGEHGNQSTLGLYINWMGR